MLYFGTFGTVYAKPIVNAVTMVEKPGVFEKNLVKPVEGVITSSFGKRTNPIKGTEEFHNGADIAVPIGTEAHAICDGKVVDTGYSPSWGNYVKYDIDKYEVFYAHLDRVLVKDGAEIKKGQTIAKTGNTGLSTGAHLHFTMYRDGAEIDPLSIFNYKITEAAENEYLARGEALPSAPQDKR